MSSIWPPQWLYPSNVSSAPNDPFGIAKHEADKFFVSLRSLVILRTTEATGFSLCKTLCLGSLEFDGGKFASLLGPKRWLFMRHRTVSLRLYMHRYFYDHIFTQYIRCRLLHINLD